MDEISFFCCCCSLFSNIFFGEVDVELVAASRLDWNRRREGEESSSTSAKKMKLAEQQSDSKLRYKQAREERRGETITRNFIISSFEQKDELHRF